VTNKLILSNVEIIGNNQQLFFKDMMQIIWIEFKMTKIKYLARMISQLNVVQKKALVKNSVF
jgi:hypothetical protein